MFWKKKAKPKLFKVPDNRRDSFRVIPHPDRPAVITLLGKNFQATDISSGGISFRNPAADPESQFKVEITLPTSRSKLFAELKILKKKEDGLCHCIFVEPDPDFEDEIHYYVLERQKEEIREEKKIV